MEPIRRILVAIDLEREETAPVEEALRFAKALGAQLTLLHVVRIPGASSASADPLLFESVSRWLHESADAKLAAVAARAAVDGVPAEVLILEGHPTERILHAIREAGAGLAVLGTHGRQGALRFLLGSVAANVVAAAPCPVLTVSDRVSLPHVAPTDADRAPAGAGKEAP